MKAPCNNPLPAACPPGLRRNPPSLLALSFALLAMVTATPKAHALSVTLDTTTLLGAGASLEFVLFDGDLAANNNHATIFGLSTDGTFQSTECSVSCVGNAGSFTLTDDGFGQFLQYLTLGTTLHFNLDFSNAFAGGDPDRLVVSLLDDTNHTLVDTNLDLSGGVPVQDALLTVDFTGGAGNLIRQATTTDPAVGITVVPSPAPLSLILPWIVWLARRGRLSRSSDSA